MFLKMKKKNEVNKNCTKEKIKLRKNFCPFKFISPFSFTKNTAFYYQITKLLKIIEKRKMSSSMKINKEDLNILNQEICLFEEKMEKNEKFIEINKNIAGLINNWQPIKKILTKEEIIIQGIIENEENRISLSCRKISEIMKDKYNLKICKSKVYNILKNRLNYSFRKTSTKTSKLLSSNYQKMTNLFLKVIIRAIQLKYELIFIDETKVQLYNSNLYCWRKKGEMIFHGEKEAKKKNLILAVSPFGLIYSKINSDNTDSNKFKEFFEGLIKSMGEERKKNSIFIMDNLPSHISLKMKKFYFENKINILTNTPYLSTFNMVELSFRKLKQKVYKKLYLNMEQVIKDIDIILKSNAFMNNLIEQYYETLLEYKSFIMKNFI